MHAEHEHWMRHALILAERGRGHVEPNPLVGAVLVKAGSVVGEGYHACFGGDHAEVAAFRAAGAEARGATLYVTLEPCCHQGKTPPCTNAVIAAGVSRVFAALRDPFPEVAGRGAAILQEAGIPLEFGLCDALARQQNAPYLKLVSTGRPYVIGKWAMTLDGKIATRTGDSQWISNETSRRRVHEVRGRVDGILVGIGTALADDPLLTARPPGPRMATRVVLDRRARLPLTSRLVTTARDTPTMICAGGAVAEAARDTLVNAGCEVFVLADAPQSTRLDLPPLLKELGQRRWTNLLVEGGGEVLSSFVEADALDELHVYIAPKLIGGRSAPGPLGGVGFERIANALALTTVETIDLDGDLFIRAVRLQT